MAISESTSNVNIHFTIHIIFDRLLERVRQCMAAAQQAEWLVPGKQASYESGLHLKSWITAV